jgi:anti-anti-sigma factor
LKVEYSVLETIGIVKIEGNVNLYELHMMRDAFEDFQDKPLTKVILDLSGVDYIDSSGIGLLIAQATKYRDKKIKFYLLSFTIQINQ